MTAWMGEALLQHVARSVTNTTTLGITTTIMSILISKYPRSDMGHSNPMLTR
jgi:hypothetical protein